MLKTCSRCKKEMELSNFPPQSKTKDGLDYRCKSCAAAYKQAWAERNRDKVKAAKDRWKKNNREKHLEQSKSNKMARAKRMPKWVDKDEIFMIHEAYRLARARTEMHGFLWHVDHIIPLRGKNVCGLHVMANLQVIPAKDNLHKLNKFEDSQV